MTTLAILAACGASPSEEDPITEPTPEAGPGSSAGTRVTGTWDGVPFTLQYAAFKRETTADPRNWVCVSNVPLTFGECEQSGGADRTMFLGPFTYQNGVPRWALVQVWLYRVGSNPQSVWAKSGTLEVLEDDPSGPMTLTMSVDFGQASAAGSVSIR